MLGLKLTHVGKRGPRPFAIKMSLSHDENLFIAAEAYYLLARQHHQITDSSSPPLELWSCDFAGKYHYVIADDAENGKIVQIHFQASTSFFLSSIPEWFLHLVSGKHAKNHKSMCRNLHMIMTHLLEWSLPEKLWISNIKKQYTYHKMYPYCGIWLLTNGFLNPMFMTNEFSNFVCIRSWNLLNMMVRSFVGIFFFTFFWLYFTYL